MNWLEATIKQSLSSSILALLTYHYTIIVFESQDWVELVSIFGESWTADCFEIRRAVRCVQERSTLPKDWHVVCAATLQAPYYLIQQEVHDTNSDNGMHCINNSARDERSFGKLPKRAAQSKTFA